MSTSCQDRFSRFYLLSSLKLFITAKMFLYKHIYHVRTRHRATMLPHRSEWGLLLSCWNKQNIWMKSNITHTYIQIYHSVGQVWQRWQETDRSVIAFVFVVWCRVLHSRIVSVFNAFLSQHLNIINVWYRFFVPCVQTLLKILWFFYWYSLTYIIKSANTLQLCMKKYYF